MDIIVEISRRHSVHQRSISAIKCDPERSLNWKLLGADRWKVLGAD